MAADSTSSASSTSRPSGDHPPPESGFPGRLERLIHERIRLGIVSALAAGQALSFNDLKQLLDTSDGNLSVHARKLEDAGYIRCIKSFQDRTPHTEYALTDTGRAALEAYLDEMERVIRMARPDG